MDVVLDGSEFLFDFIHDNEIIFRLQFAEYNDVCWWIGCGGVGMRGKDPG